MFLTPRNLLLVGVSPQPQLSETSLDLGQLHQVLRDEELARKLQEEEEKQLRGVRDPYRAELVTLPCCDLEAKEEEEITGYC